MRLLVVNPGSTTTKFGVFDGTDSVFTANIRHEHDFDGLPDLMSQCAPREALILEALSREGIDLASLGAVVGRGGLLHPLDGGVYEVGEDMVQDLRACRYGSHASNLGGLIASELANRLGLTAYIADPVIVDEMEPLARLSGWPDIPRQSIFHALNQKAVARRYARETGVACEDLRLIVAHLGGGISVGVHQKGRVIDVNNALGGDGPYSPERTGGLPLFAVIDHCFADGVTPDGLKDQFVGHGGLTAYLGTSDALAIGERIRGGDEEARLVFEGMAYQIAKEIGAAATVLKGQVDSVILTGGLARDELLLSWIIPRIRFIAPVTVYPGEDELIALAETVGLALEGRMPIRRYQREET